MMLASNLENISIGEAGVLALLGYAVVFFGLILLMCVIMVMGKLFVSAEKKKSAKAESAKSGVTAAAVPAAIPQEAPVAQPAPGTAGQLKLYDTPPKTAAMLMAIVADKMGKPINELRFISIKEVK